jgi:S-adenosylmethionine/arginine decarboxylase-like enzyme
MKKKKEITHKRIKESHPTVHAYPAKESLAEKIYTICTGTIVSCDISKIINGQPRNE